MKKIMIIIAVILILAGCDLTSPARYVEEELVIAGYLQAGKVLSLDNPIFVGKTVSAEGGNVLDTIVMDADVTINEQESGLEYDLEFGGNESKVGYYNEALQIHAGWTYRITVDAVLDSEAVTAWAETTVPAEISIDMDYNNLATGEYGYAEEYAAELPKIAYDEVEDNFPVYTEYESGEVVYSYYHYYCLEEFSVNLEFTDPVMGYDHLEEDDEDAYNSPMSGNMRSSSMMWRYQPQESDDGNWYLLEESYDGGFYYYGRYRLTIYSVDDHFYTYKYHSESYLNGGIHGGIGYFGSVSGEDFYTEIIK